eukprot:15468969-Alexandrium_andersonii.AAC.1
MAGVEQNHIDIVYPLPCVGQVAHLHCLPRHIRYRNERPKATRTRSREAVHLAHAWVALCVCLCLFGARFDSGSAWVDSAGGQRVQCRGARRYQCGSAPPAAIDCHWWSGLTSPQLDINTKLHPVHVHAIPDALSTGNSIFVART